MVKNMAKSLIPWVHKTHTQGSQQYPGCTKVAKPMLRGHIDIPGAQKWQNPCQIVQHVPSLQQVGDFI